MIMLLLVFLLLHIRNHQKSLTSMPSEIVDQHLSDLAAAGYYGDGMAADSIPEGHLDFFVTLAFLMLLVRCWILS